MERLKTCTVFRSGLWPDCHGKIKDYDAARLAAFQGGFPNWERFCLLLSEDHPSKHHFNEDERKTPNMDKSDFFFLLMDRRIIQAS